MFSDPVVYTNNINILVYLIKFVCSCIREVFPSLTTRQFERLWISLMLKVAAITKIASAPMDLDSITGIHNNKSFSKLGKDLLPGILKVSVWTSKNWLSVRTDTLKPLLWNTLMLLPQPLIMNWLYLWRGFTFEFSIIQFILVKNWLWKRYSLPIKQFALSRSSREVRDERS